MLSIGQKALRWRGPIEYNVRQVIGWTVNLSLLFICLFVSLIYAAKFGNNQFTQVAVGWLMAYALTFILVEPFQVCFLAGARRWQAPSWARQRSR